mgnify:CR=1 FL=1
MSVATKKPSANGKSTTAEKVIALPKLNIEVMRVRLVGDSPLICHKWSEKAKEEMRAKQFKLAKVAKAAKDPEADFRGSLYEHPGGGYGFPAIAFKSAAVDACSHVDGITKVEARGAFHISEQFGPNVTDLRSAELVRIEGEPTMREDMVRVGMGTADLRYRGEFRDWSATFLVRFNANVLSAEQIVNLFNTAGFAIGVGEWRPQKDGMNGMFHVA